jgi:hypothetical protein
MHDRVEPVVLVVDAEKGVERLPIIGEVDAHEAATTLPGRIEVDDVMPDLAEFPHNGAPELA